MKYVKCNLSLKSGFGFLWLACRRSRLGWYSTLSIQSPRNLYKSQIPSLLVPSLGRFMNHSSNNWNLNYFTLFKHWELLISWNSVSFTNVLPVSGFFQYGKVNSCDEFRLSRWLKVTQAKLPLSVFHLFESLGLNIR